MSVSDPLLKRLKTSILTLRTVPEGTKIDDHHCCVRQLCETLEDILRKGLKQPSSLFQPQKKDYWHWLEALPTIHQNGSQSVHPVYGFCLTEVKNSKRVVTAVGKGRLFLRLLLQKRILAWPMKALISSLGVIHTFYDDLYSILGNEILAQIFLSLVHELGQVQFDLCIRNASFLDDSWQLPVYRLYEFVPCKALGLDLVTLNGHHVIERVVPGSVADEDNKIEAGDILDELLGYTLKAQRIRLKDLVKDNHGWPVHCCVVKARTPDGSTFPPLLHLLRMAHMQNLLVRSGAQDGQDSDFLSGPPGKEEGKIPVHARLEEEFPDDVPAQNPDMFPVYRVRFVGSTPIGSDGGVHRIEGGVEKILSEFNDPSQYRPVRIELGEKEVIVSALRDQSDIIIRHAYPQISSCGRRIDCTRFLAYIAGESTCTISTNFQCYVFEAKNDTESKTILCSIAQGFERTHWAL